MNKCKMLAAVQLPPPVHGASLRNQEFIASPIIQGRLEVTVLPIQTSASIGDIGHVSARKIVSTILMIIGAAVLSFRTRPDVFYITLSTSGVAFLKDCLILLAAKRFSSKQLVHLRNQGLKRSHESLVYRVLGRMALSRTHALVLSRSLVADASYFYEEGDITVVHNCIDDDDAKRSLMCDDKTLNPKLSELLKHASAKDSLYFYHIANLSEDKGSLDVLRAFVALGDCSAKLIMIGPWENVDLEEAAKSLLRQYPNIAKRIVFLGALYGPEKFRAMSACDVHLFPTKYDKECFPGVVLEAMSCGIPTIGSRHGALPDIIDHGVDGYLVEKGDVLSLVKYMKLFLAEEGDARNKGKMALTKYNARYTRNLVHGAIVNVACAQP